MIRSGFFSLKVSCLCAVVASFCIFSEARAAEFEPVDEHVRAAYLSRAQVWEPTDPSTMDVVGGPKTPIAVPPDSIIDCRYVEWKGKPSGTQPKFICERVDSGEKVRIKYGKERLEVFSETIATRLFWALGFYADVMYPVRVNCIGCPEKDPFRPKKGERRVTRLIPFATMERNYAGKVIEVKEDEGIKLKELEKIDSRAGGATHAQLDALRLLAVFVQHGDQKPSNQRLACPEEYLVDRGDGKLQCSKPVAMIQDLGATFGKADQFTSDHAKMHYEDWHSVNIWNLLRENEHFKETQRHICIGTLTNSVSAEEDGMQDPPISEEGRKFLAGLLSQLSVNQIRDLFKMGRADQTGQMIKDHGTIRPVTIEDWTNAFLEKRQEILDRKCPE